MQDVPLLSPMGTDVLVYHLDDINDVDLSMNLNSEDLKGQSLKSIHKEEKDNILLFYVGIDRTLYVGFASVEWKLRSDYEFD